MAAKAMLRSGGLLLFLPVLAALCPLIPSLAQQAANLAKTARDVARDPRWVDDTEYERRMTLCRACPLYDEKQNRCRKCGCRLKGKARFKAGKCPIQKW